MTEETIVITNLPISPDPARRRLVFLLERFYSQGTEFHFLDGRSYTEFVADAILREFEMVRKES